MKSLQIFEKFPKNDPTTVEHEMQSWRGSELHLSKRRGMETSLMYEPYTDGWPRYEELSVDVKPP